jgi:hypothetical protein
MKVRVGKEYSPVHETPFAVPQGSCLGPYLYLAYASTLEDVVTDDMGTLTGFADDHGLRKSFKANDREREYQVIHELETSLSTIKDWMDSNRLQMNTAKTELILFGSKTQLQKCTSKHMNVSGDTLERSSEIKYLGVTLDQNLTLKRHIALKCQKASYNLHNIRLIRNSLNKEACKQVVHGLVLSHLDYCNSIFMGLSKGDIMKMQRIQNAAAKLILNLKKSESSTVALKTLHWLPIASRIQFKVLTITHKCIHGQAPGYLTYLLKLRQNTQYNLRSEKGTNILEIPRTKAKTFADRSFSVFAPTLWNSLPDYLRQIVNLEQFRKALKTYLFKEHYGDQ